MKSQSKKANLSAKNVDFISKKNHDRQRGFTLVELAVVLMLFGVVLGGGLVGFAHFTHQVKAQKTDDQFNLIFNALSTYAQRNSRLPCPADPNGDGSERMGGFCFNNSSNADLYKNTQGVVPWRELGLPEEIVRDGWGRYITYKPAPQLTAHYKEAEMQNVNGTGGDLDINDACRSPLWYTKDDAGNPVHLDRAKAMFCCSTPPRDTYLDANQTAGSGLPANWRSQAIVASGQVNAAGLDETSTMPNNVPVISTPAWSDDSTDGALNGDFETPDHGTDSNGPDAAMSRAMNNAVTLISHGGNGFLSFMNNKAETERAMAEVNGGINNAQVVLADDEALNVWPPQVATATTYHPKASGNSYDPLGKNNGASDDRVAFLRTDQLLSRAGSAGCLRPGDFEEGCTNTTYDDVIYLVDTSGSMDCEFNSTEVSGCSGHSFSDQRIGVALDVLETVMKEHAESELREDNGYGKVGFSRFKSNTLSVDHDEASEIFISSNQSDPIEDQVADALDAIEDALDSSHSVSGDTPVIESVEKLTLVLMEQATTKLCREMVVERNPDNSPKYGMPSDCDSINAEYEADPTAFINNYNPKTFNPSNIEPAAVVLMSDGNDTSSYRWGEKDPYDASGSNALPPGEAVAHELPRYNKHPVTGSTMPEDGMEGLMMLGETDLINNIYNDYGEKIADHITAFNDKFNNAFAAAGDGITINKEMHLNVADMMDNEGLEHFVNAINPNGRRCVGQTRADLEACMSMFQNNCP